MLMIAHGKLQVALRHLEELPDSQELESQLYVHLVQGTNSAWWFQTIGEIELTIF